MSNLNDSDSEQGALVLMMRPPGALTTAQQLSKTGNGMRTAVPIARGH